MVKIIKNIKSVILYIKCNRAIKKANRLAVLTGRKHLVLMYNGRPIVISKQNLKARIKAKLFLKGFTAEKAESLAIYKTR